MAVRPDLCPACNTFVRADWTTHCGSCGAPLVQESPTGNASWAPGPASQIHEPTVSKGRALSTILFAIVVALVVVAGTVMLIGKDKTKSGSEALTISTTSTTNPDTFADTLFLEQSAFNPKWTALGVHHETAKDLANLSATCFPNDPLMGNTAVAYQDYTWNLQANDLEGGHLYYGIFTTDSPATADHQHQQLNSKAAETCVQKNAEDIMKSGAGNGAILYDNTFKRILRTNIPVAYVDYRANGKVIGPLGHSDNVTEEVIYLQHGNARVRIEFSDCGCKLGPPPDKDAIINAAAAKLATVPS